MSVRWDILGVGVVAVDDLVYLDRYPVAGSKVEVRVKRREGGGLTATALVAASRLGARTAFVNVLGHDELSRFTIQELEREGVDCRPILRQPGARPYHSVIIVDQSTGERTILYSAEGVVPLKAEDITEEMVAGCRLVFVDHLAADAGTRAFELAHAYNIPVVADIERETLPGAKELMARADHLIVGVALAGRLTGETQPERMVRALSSAGRACCAVTAGEHGCWYAERGDAVRHWPAFKVDVVDTTGCGDVFHGAYAACIARGQSVAQAIRIATATAGLKATRPGGRAGIPDWDTVARYLEEDPPVYPATHHGQHFQI
jgi:sulfofructose kinase